MRFAERLGSAWLALRGKSAPPAGSYSYGWGGGSSWADAFKFRRAPSPSELVDSYKSLVYACVNLNANAVARTPLRLYATTKSSQHRPKCAVKEVSRRTRDRLKGLDYASKAMAGVEHVEEVTDHPLLDAVMKVNEDLDHVQLITYTVMSLDIVGSAYWWPFMGRLGVPEELWALPPHLVFPVFTSGTMVPDAYNFGGEIYPKDELIRFRRLSAKNPYGQGYGPEQAAIEYARLEDTFVSIQDNLLSNGPRPSLIVSHKDPKGSFGPAERQRLEADMDRRGRGGRSGGVFVVDGAAAVTPISYSPTDLGALKISSYDMERIANCFDVPVSMLKTEDVNRANAEAGLEQHSRNAVEPRCRLIASTLTRWTHSLDHKGQRGWDRLFWAFDSVVLEDKKAESELHKTYLDMGVLTRNEVRLELGYERVEGGDEPLVQGSLVTLSSVTDGSDLEPKAVQSSEGHSTGEEGTVKAELKRKVQRTHTWEFRKRVRRFLRPGFPFGGFVRLHSAVKNTESGPPSGSGENCGTGAGGFQPGNTCGAGGGGGGRKRKRNRKRKRGPSSGVHAPDRSGIIHELGAVVQPHVRSIQALDPRAQVGFRGSLARGFKGERKGNAPFDPLNFDVDAFIVSDALAARYQPHDWFRAGGDIGEIKEIQRKVDSSLRKSPTFRGMRRGQFTFRIFWSGQVRRFLREGDSQIYFLRGK